MLMEAARFTYVAPWEYGRCNCVSGCVEKVMLNNPYSYRCLSMEFKAQVLEGEFKGFEVLVKREFTNAQVDPTSGAYMFPGRKCCVSGVVEKSKTYMEDDGSFTLQATRVQRREDMVADSVSSFRSKVHRFYGSKRRVADMTASEIREQEEAVFDC